MPGLLRRRRQLVLGRSGLDAAALVGDIYFPLAADVLAVKGGYTPTSTRSTTAAFTDYEGVVRMASVNELRFEGGRRVENLCPNSEPTSGWIAEGTTPPTLSYENHLGLNSAKVQFDQTMTPGFSTCRASGNTASSKFYIPLVGYYVSRAMIHLSRALIGTESIRIVVTGAGGFTDTTITSANSTALSGTDFAAWSGYRTSSVIGYHYFAVYPVAALASPLTVWITKCQVENITGSAYQLPSEYIPTAGATASKWFNTRPDGTPIVPKPKLLMEGQSQNKVTAKTANPVDTTGVTKSGDAASVLSVVDDAAALAAAGLSAICPSGKVYKLDNSAGTAYALVVFEGTVGNTNSHSMSLYVRGSGTTKLSMSGAGAIELIIATTSSYTKYKNENKTPGATTWKLSLQVNAGAVAYFILPQLEELPVVTSVIPNDTGSALTRTADTLSWPLSAELQAMLSIDKAWSVSLANQTGAGSTQCDLTDATALFKFSTFDASPYTNSGKMVITRDDSNRLAWGFLGAVQDTTGLVVYKDKERTIRGFNKEASVGAVTTFDVVADCKAEGTVVLDLSLGYSGYPTLAMSYLACKSVTNNLIYTFNGGTKLVSYDGANAAASLAFTFVAGDNIKVVLRISTDLRLFKISHKKNMEAILHGPASAFDGAFDLSSPLLLLGTILNAPTKFSNLRFFKRWLSDAELQRL